MSNADLDKFLGECPTHKRLPWKIGAMESGQVAIDSDDGKEVTGWIDPEDAYLILNQQQRIEELERTWLSPEAYETLMRERQEILHELNDPVLLSKWQQLEKERDKLRERVKLLRGTLLRIANRFNLGNGKCCGAAEQHTFNEATEALAATEPTSIRNDT